MSTADVKKIIAAHFGVDEKNVIPSKYSFTVIDGGDNDKEFLKNLLNEIREKAERLGIIINEHKTQIIKLSNGFTFLKMRYLFTDTGKIIIKPCKQTITRERRKLRKLKKRMDAGLITQEEITEQYKSWRGNITKYNSYKSVKNIDALYKSLFGG